MDTSRQGRGRGGRGGGERKRRWGNRKATMLWLPLLPGPCVSGATGGVQEGDKRQLKPVEVGHAPPPGLFAGRGRTGPLGLLGEPLLPDHGDQGSDSPSSLHAPPAQAFPGRGVPPCASSRAPHLPLSPGSASSLPAFPGSLRPGCLRVPEPFPSHPA